MKIIVIGAGLLGVTSAYYLQDHGHDVTVLERESLPALGASYGNGGYAQASVPDPWNAPGVLKIFKQAWIANLKGKGDHSAFSVSTRALPGLIKWGMKFLSHATRETFQSHLVSNMHLAQYTQSAFNQINQSEQLNYSYSDKGGLLIFRNSDSLNGYIDLVGCVRKHGTRVEQLDQAQLLTLEPSLEEVGQELAGAVHYPDDSSGNAREFCEQLAAITENRGVKFEYGSVVSKILKEVNGVRVLTLNGDMTADAVVIAAGAQSKTLGASLGIHLPIVPVKGYSISIPMGGWGNRPRHVIADMDIHAGINPMGDTLRIAGTAEFTGFSPGVSEQRLDYMMGLAQRLFPTFSQSVSPELVDPWAGYRPLSVDGLPMIGATDVDNVYVNTGHGGLGWTQCAGSSKALADLISSENGEFDLASFSINRFRR
ncbi:MAG: FAD-dependent oxidoreductase [Gammaproteobacteria bacterium]